MEMEQVSGAVLPLIFAAVSLASHVTAKSLGGP